MKKRMTRFLTGLMIFSLMVPGISGCGNTSGDITAVTTGNTPTEEGVDVCDASDTDSATEPDAAESSEEVGVLVDGYHQITATEAMKMVED